MCHTRSLTTHQRCRTARTDAPPAHSRAKRTTAHSRAKTSSSTSRSAIEHSSIVTTRTAQRRRSATQPRHEHGRQQQLVSQRRRLAAPTKRHQPIVGHSAAPAENVRGTRAPRTRRSAPPPAPAETSSHRERESRPKCVGDRPASTGHDRNVAIFAIETANCETWKLNKTKFSSYGKARKASSEEVRRTYIGRC